MSMFNNQQRTKETLTDMESFDHIEEMKVMEIDQKIDSYKSLQSQLEAALLVFADPKKFPTINPPREVEKINHQLQISEKSLLASDLGYEFLLNSQIEKIVATIDWDIHDFDMVPSELVYQFLDKYGHNNLPRLSKHISYQIKNSLIIFLKN